MSEYLLVFSELDVDDREVQRRYDITEIEAQHAHNSQTWGEGATSETTELTEKALTATLCDW